MMSDHERGELSERVAVLEALLKKHEEGALSRKADISSALEKITDKLNAQQCGIHNINMLNMRSEITAIREKEIPALGSRLTFLEKCFWSGLGGLAVLEIALRFIVK